MTEKTSAQTEITYDYRVSAEGMSDKFYRTEKGAMNAAKRLSSGKVASSRTDRTGARCSSPRKVTVYRDGWADGLGIVEHVEIARF